MGLLEELRQKAAGISSTREVDAERISRYADNVDKALRRGFGYFLELAGYLNVIKPENKRSYVIPRLGNLEGLYQSEFFVDYRTTSVLDKQRLDHFYMRYVSATDRIIERRLDFIGAEKLRSVLWESHMEFDHQEVRNEQARVISGSFQVPSKVRSELVFRGDYNSGVVRVVCRNVAWLGRDEFVYDAEELDVSLFEDYVKFITGEQSNLRERGRHQASNGQQDAES